MKIYRNHSDDRFFGMAEVVASSMDEASFIEVLDNGVRITTSCIYPSNGLVRVCVRGGNTSVLVSDEGGALSEISSAGIQTHLSDKFLNTQVRSQGLKVSNGEIHSPKMPIESVALGIVLVANASKDVAQWCYDTCKLKRDRDFKALLSEFLEKRFSGSVDHNAVIVGASNKPHKFANVLSLPNGRRLIIDPVANEPSSINARVVANLDVKAANDDRVEQRIVFDDQADWSASDLNLLNVGATAVPFSRISDVIERIAARG